MADNSSDPIALLNDKLDRLNHLLERAVPAEKLAPEFDAADAFVWNAGEHYLQPVPKVNRVEMVLLKGIDTVRDILIDNTRRFALGHSANNALLWGSRGMGKSSLVKAA